MGAYKACCSSTNNTRESSVRVFYGRWGIRLAEGQQSSVKPARQMLRESSWSFVGSNIPGVRKLVPGRKHQESARSVYAICAIHIVQPSSPTVYLHHTAWTNIADNSWIVATVQLPPRRLMLSTSWTRKRMKLSGSQCWLLRTR